MRLMIKKKITRHTTKPKARMNKKHNSLNLLRPLIVLAVITLGVVAYYSWPRPAQLSINLVGDASGTVTLALTPATTTIEPNTEATFTLTADAGTSHITTAQVELTFDSSKVGTPTVTLSSAYPIVLVDTKVENGKISFTIGAPTSSGGITGTSNLATIKIKPTVIGDSTLNFTEQTTIIVAERTVNYGNDLKSADGATVTVAAAAASPSSASSADPSTAASADPSSAASPSIAASPSPTVTPQKPDKPTGLRHNCFDGGNKITLRWDAVSGVSSYKVRMDQKDGSNDKSTDGVSRTEYDYNILSDQKYSWWVHSTKDGVDSEEAKIDEVVCPKTSTSTLAASPTLKPTVKPTVKATAKPATSPQASLKPASTNPSLMPLSSPKGLGSLNDVFTDQGAVENSSESTTKPGFFAQIALGWKAIFEGLAKLFQ